VRSDSVHVLAHVWACGHGGPNVYTGTDTHFERTDTPFRLPLSGPVNHVEARESIMSLWTFQDSTMSEQLNLGESNKKYYFNTATSPSELRLDGPQAVSFLEEYRDVLPFESAAALSQMSRSKFRRIKAYTETCMASSLRQTYGYWQDQPGLFITTDLPGRVAV